MLLKVLLLMNFLYFHGNCKILRVRNHFDGNFALADPNSRITSNCVRNITKYTTPKECAGECIKEKKCISINRHKYSGFCELLAISKFNDTNLLQRDLDWVHFETDEDERNVGQLCIDLSPCQTYEVCEITFDCEPAFICRCKDGFSGLKCENYTGPGTKKSEPAASCRLLMLKHKSIPDGEYWFKGKEKKMKCQRRVDGGYTKWSPFSPCSVSYPCGVDGKQTRNRSCTNPSPKGGGHSCDRLGPNKEVKHCQTKCPACSSKFFFDTHFETSEGNLFTTFDKMLKEYKVEFDLKIDVTKLSADPPHNLLHFTTDGDHGVVGYRQPAIWLRNKVSEIQMEFYAGINANPNHGHIAKIDILSFEKWKHIVVSQKEIEGKVFWRIYIDGKEVHSQLNTIPIEYSNMKLYLSDPWFPTGFVLIKNMYLEGIC